MLALIQVDKRDKQANERARYMCINTAILWGWRDPVLTNKQRCRIAKAACRQVAYNFGYRKPLGSSQMPAWYGMLNRAILSGESSDPLSPSFCLRKSYIDSIENIHPGYILELFRYAQMKRGGLENFQVLSEVMNIRSGEPGEDRPTLSLNRHHLIKWF